MQLFGVVQVLLVLVVTCSGIPPPYTKRSEAVRAFSSLGDEHVDTLRNFGYFPESKKEEYSDAEWLADELEAVQNFQRTYGLDVTGELNEDTRKLLEAPRCGVSDADIVRKSGDHLKTRYKLIGTTWEKCTLTYRVTGYSTDLSNAHVDQGIALAAAIWEAAVPGLTIKKVSSGEDMEIYFATGNHGFGYAFDGKGKVLAHAFQPKYGDLHFDEDEDWIVKGISGGSGKDLVQVATHELGHSLGLGHSDDKTATMYAIYNYGWTGELSNDDIQGIRQVFSCSNAASHTTTTPKPQTTKTTTAATTAPPDEGTCTKVPKVPFGSWRPGDCDSTDVPVGSTCRLTCSDGLKPDTIGHDRVTCIRKAADKVRFDKAIPRCGFTMQTPDSLSATNIYALQKTPLDVTQTSRMQFTVRASSAAWIALSATDDIKSTSSIYHFALFDSENSECSVRMPEIQGEVQKSVPCSSPAPSYTGDYWLSWRVSKGERTLRFGLGKSFNKNTILEFVHDDPFDVNYLWLGTGYGTSGDWNVYAK